ncbi:MAG: hypothetical protein HZA10_05045 [Nitrospirae bacterium]|nr:hypothetical protein [Nitrospirota bacterium]
MKTVIDTSTLISLAKINFLEILKKLKREILIPETVYGETVLKGEEKSLTDATVIKNFIKDNNIRHIAVKEFSLNLIKERVSKNLAAGDEAVMAAAVQEKILEIITNDDGLGKIAASLGIKVSASPDLLLEGLRSKIMKFEDYEFFLKNLVVEKRITSAIAEFYSMEGKKYAKS